MLRWLNNVSVYNFQGIQISVTVLNVESNNAIDTFIYKITSTSGAVRKSVEIASGKRESNSRSVDTNIVIADIRKSKEMKEQNLIGIKLIIKLPTTYSKKLAVLATFDTDLPIVSE